MKPQWLEYVDSFHNAIRSWAQVALALGVWIWQRRQAQATEKEVGKENEDNS